MVSTGTCSKKMIIEDEIMIDVRALINAIMVKLIPTAQAGKESCNLPAAKLAGLGCGMFVIPGLIPSEMNT